MNSNPEPLALDGCQPSRLVDAANLTAAGVVAVSMGTIALVCAIMLSDASILLLGFSTMAIGVLLLIRGWLRIRRHIQGIRDVVGAGASIPATQYVPLGRWKRGVLAGALLMIGALILLEGILLMVRVQQFGVEITLMGIALTAIGLLGLVSISRGG